MTTAAAPSAYGEPVSWEPDKPKFKPVRLLISWFLTAIALLVAAAIVPGVDIVELAGTRSRGRGRRHR